MIIYLPLPNPWLAAKTQILSVWPYISIIGFNFIRAKEYAILNTMFLFVQNCFLYLKKNNNVIFQRIIDLKKLSDKDRVEEYTLSIPLLLKNNGKKIDFSFIHIKISLFYIQMS